MGPIVWAGVRLRDTDGKTGLKCTRDGTESGWHGKNVVGRIGGGLGRREIKKYGAINTDESISLVTFVTHSNREANPSS